VTFQSCTIYIFYCIGITFASVNFIFIIFNSHGFATKIAAHIQMDEQYFVADSMSIT
jgi:hypothetical protein